MNECSSSSSSSLRGLFLSFSSSFSSSRMQLVCTWVSVRERGKKKRWWHRKDRIAKLASVSFTKCLVGGWGTIKQQRTGSKRMQNAMQTNCGCSPVSARICECLLAMSTKFKKKKKSQQSSYVCEQLKTVEWEWRSSINSRQATKNETILSRIWCKVAYIYYIKKSKAKQTSLDLRTWVDGKQEEWQRRDQLVRDEHLDLNCFRWTRRIYIIPCTSTNCYVKFLSFVIKSVVLNSMIAYEEEQHRAENESKNENKEEAWSSCCWW